MHAYLYERGYVPSDDEKAAFDVLVARGYRVTRANGGHWRGQVHSADLVATNVRAIRERYAAAGIPVISPAEAALWPDEGLTAYDDELEPLAIEEEVFTEALTPGRPEPPEVRYEHTGGGWYDVYVGDRKAERVRGKAGAEETIKRLGG